MLSHCSAINHIKDLLKPYSAENGGPLTVDHVAYVEGRGNLILGYSSPGASGTVGFVGSHLDVVPANPADWERNPFQLVVEVSLEKDCTIHCLESVANLELLYVHIFKISMLFYIFFKKDPAQGASLIRGLLEVYQSIYTKKHKPSVVWCMDDYFSWDIYKNKFNRLHTDVSEREVIP